MKKRHIVLSVLGVLLLSFAGTDYYVRGQLYYTKRVLNFLYLSTWQAVFPSSGPVELYVRIHADQDYRQTHPDWETRLTGVFDAAAERFARDFDIRLMLLNTTAWDRPEGIDSYAAVLKYAARKLERLGAQISVIMTADDAGNVSEESWFVAGIAHRLGDIVIVGDDALLVHELGHLFGAVDYGEGSPGYDAETTYSYRYADKTDAIDPENRARILKHKYRPLW
jgi:hypothetical protein